VYLSKALESYTANYTKNSFLLHFISVLFQILLFSLGGNALGQYDAIYPENTNF